MNEITLLREAGPEAPALTHDVRNAARAALMAEIDSARPQGLRLPSRKVRWRMGVGVVAVAASWAAAVVIVGPGSPADSVRLVDFETPTFPLSFEPAPAGMRPGFSGDASGSSFAEYHDVEGRDNFSVSVHEDEPDLEELNIHLETEPAEDVRVDDQEATLVRGTQQVWCEDGLSICGTREFAQLVWEFQDDMWVLMEGDGTYRDAGRLIALAETVVDRPQRATLAAELAPDGWSLEFYKMGRVLTLVNEQFEQQTVTVQVPLTEDVTPPEQLLDQLMGPIGPLVPVTVNGRPASLVLCRTDFMVDGEFARQWFLQAQFEDGTVYELQVPDAFTQAQVVEFAEAVTYNP